MSYCRWSTDGFQCDIYAYESDVYTIHVAGNRVVGLAPFDDALPPAGSPVAAFETYAAAYNAHLAAVNGAKREDIDLPHAGETFYEPDLKSFKDRMLSLRALGYRFPDHVLESIDEEIAMETTP